jgi:hypothetical protein
LRELLTIEVALEFEVEGWISGLERIVAILGQTCTSQASMPVGHAAPVFDNQYAVSTSKELGSSFS